MNRVVITGMGIYSVLGKNIEDVRNSLYEGKSGIVFDESRKPLGFRSGLTGYLERPVLKGILDRRSRIGLAEQGEYAYLSTLEAMKHANLDPTYFEKK
jgi:3-oxoacyl-[acyl-carrier-protein] synthase I